MMGGRIWVESDAGRGQHVPLHGARSSASPSSADGRGVPPELRGLPVLVVDDNATNRRILEETLDELAACVPTLVDGGGEAALAALRARRAARRAVRPGAARRPHAGHGRLRDGRADRRAETGAMAPTIMMLTSAGELGDARPLPELGLSRATSSSRSGRRRCCDGDPRALGRARRPTPVAVRRRRVAPAVHALRILLAEDNLVNQRVAVGLLEKARAHRGRWPRTAGRRVEAFDAEPFDLVLMDMQMPEMSGIEAIAAIRDREADHRHAHADRRDDGARAEGRPRALSGGRRRRLRREADCPRPPSSRKSSAVLARVAAKSIPPPLSRVAEGLRRCAWAGVTRC